MNIGGTVNLSFSQQVNVQVNRGTTMTSEDWISQLSTSSHSRPPQSLRLRAPTRPAFLLCCWCRSDRSWVVSLVLNVGISDEDVSSGFVDPDTNADPDVLTFDESNSNQTVNSCLGYSQQFRSLLSAS